jgi:hypothetical protein
MTCFQCDNYIADFDCQSLLGENFPNVMTSVQIEIDEKLLESIANDKDFQAMQISEFFSKAAKFVLKLKTEHEIDKQFERAYSHPGVREAFEREVKEWIGEQAWNDWDEREWLKAAACNPAFEALKDSIENIYTVKDGKPFKNPDKKE